MSEHDLKLLVANLVGWIVLYAFVSWLIAKEARKK